MTGQRILGFAAALALAIAPLSALAATITFDPLAGPNGTPYTGHTEAGFDVTATSGAWAEAFFVGNPTPSIYTFSDSASILLGASGGGLFTFESIDLGTGSLSVGSYSYLITGSVAGSDVLSVAGTFNGSNAGGFLTVLSTNTLVAIDELRISLADVTDITSFNVDNIVLGTAGGAPIPEPTAALCFGVGLLMVGAKTRRRSA